MALSVTRLEAAPLDPLAEEVMVPMRDGVRLATDVYLPEGRVAGGGRRPAVLVRLPYDKAGRYTFMPMLAPYVNERGYAFVVQDVRGKFRSEGETVPFVHEVEDGYDTLDWVAAQPWSDGTVVMFGDSYYGFTQWAAVASGHPSLRAIVPRVTSADLATFNWSGEGVTALYGADYLAHYWIDAPIYDFPVDWSVRPLAAVYDEAFAAIGVRSRGFDLLLDREVRGRPSPDPFAGAHPFDRLKVPVLHAVGWFDNLAPDSLRDYMSLAGRADRAELNYLIADSNDHENYRLDDVPFTEADDHDANDEAIRSMIPIYLDPALDFFDAVLAGEASRLAPVRWHLGNEAWRESPVWPPAAASQARLFLTAAGRAAEDPAAGGGGRMTADREPAASIARWVHDPADLVPSTVQNPFAFLFEFPDEREVERRPDVLTFTSSPADEPLDLAGPAAAWLRVDSSGPSLHLFAKLADVAPDGAAHMLTRGQAVVAAPDPDRLVPVDLNHLAYRLLPGHSLRLQIASSDYPLYLPHPGTAESPWLATRGVANEQVLLTGGDTSSYLALSVLPT
jgi:putative CocE/NonD family hydrolase